MWSNSWDTSVVLRLKQISISNLYLNDIFGLNSCESSMIPDKNYTGIDMTIKLSIYFQHGLLLNGMSRIASHYWRKIGCECQFQLIPCGRSAYLLPGLIGGGHNHSVADSKSNEKVKDVTQVRGDLVQGLTVKTHELHLTAALIDFIHELGIWSNILFLSNQ